jgi:hypothetical protein
MEVSDPLKKPPNVYDDPDLQRLMSGLVAIVAGNTGHAGVDERFQSAAVAAG